MCSADDEVLSYSKLNSNIAARIIIIAYNR